MKKRPQAAGARRQRSSASEPTTARPDWIVFALAVVGLAISIYLTITKLSGSAAAFCEAGSGCDIVQASRWSTFLYVPTSAWGALLYAGIAVLAFIGLTATRWVYAFVLASAATGFSAYLTWISAFTLKAFCPWCLSVATIAVLTLAALLIGRPATGSRRAWTRPARVAIVGVATAVITIFFAAGVYVMDPATGGSTYAAQIAQHLRDTGGVMYGAFW